MCLRHFLLHPFEICGVLWYERGKKKKGGESYRSASKCLHCLPFNRIEVMKGNESKKRCYQVNCWARDGKIISPVHELGMLSTELVGLSPFFCCACCKMGEHFRSVQNIFLLFLLHPSEILIFFRQFSFYKNIICDKLIWSVRPAYLLDVLMYLFIWHSSSLQFQKC